MINTYFNVLIMIIKHILHDKYLEGSHIIKFELYNRQ
jgi:hypothetical protein